MPLLAEMALAPRVAAGGDRGDPVALAEAPDGPFRTLARRVVTDVAPPLGAPGCSARLLDALTAGRRLQSLVAVVAGQQDRDRAVALDDPGLRRTTGPWARA